MGFRLRIPDDDIDPRDTVVRLFGRFGHSCLSTSSVRRLSSAWAGDLIIAMTMQGHAGASVGSCRTATATPWPNRSMVSTRRVIRHYGPWRVLVDVEYATLEYVGFGVG